MIFQPYHIYQMKQGVKTETRRVWKRQCAFAGRWYPVMRDYKKGHRHDPEDGYIRITEVVQQRLGDMTEEAARAEGGYVLSQYKDVWIGINGSWDPEQVVYVVRFVWKLEKVPI